ncbi:Aldo-keto reductase AKR2E4 [Eumeta japonica]|uniref:Aldo-keto reductase AKR2E4 n=1 Tax=Eumeta variegata TaxID=151549 RepID=A0A4C1ZE99_EUMVA|nr:Aldo-keto reductase AKR2E4 [Eumeta japonica]
MKLRTAPDVGRVDGEIFPVEFSFKFYAIRLRLLVLCRRFSKLFPVINEGTTYYALNDGNKMPAVALGTSLGHLADGTRILSVNHSLAKAVEWALEAGYAHVDTASLYRTEDEVGLGVRNYIDKNNANRNDVFVTTKVCKQCESPGSDHCHMLPASWVRIEYLMERAWSGGGWNRVTRGNRVMEEIWDGGTHTYETKQRKLLLHSASFDQKINAFLGCRIYRSRRGRLMKPVNIGGGICGHSSFGCLDGVVRSESRSAHYGTIVECPRRDDLTLEPVEEFEYRPRELFLGLRSRYTRARRAYGLWNDAHERGAVVPALRESLQRLRLERVDAYLVHYPMAYTKTGEISDVDYLETWRGMEDAVRLNLTKSIGVSNFNLTQMERLYENATIKPAILQIEVNPSMTNSELVDWCRSRGVVVMAYSPFGAVLGRRSDAPPPRAHDPYLMALAEKYEKTVPQILLRYLVDRELVAIPRSTNKQRIEQNIDIFDFSLTDEEVERLNAFNSNYRLRTPAKWYRHPEFPFEKKNLTDEEIQYIIEHSRED